jgi:hypothetical protein
LNFDNKIRAFIFTYTKTGIIALVTVVLFVLVYRHTPWMNGPWYWKWPWRRLDGIGLYFSMFLGFIPFLIAQVLNDKKKMSLWLSLPLIMVSMFCMEMISIGMQSASFDFTRIIRIVENPVTTSYFTDALNVSSIKQFLSSFHENLDSFNLHSRNKPPGFILYYVIVLLFFKEPHTAALVGGIFIGLLATLTIPATYFLTRVLTNDRKAAFNAASYISITPALILFFPEFDQILPVLTCLLIGTWVLALEKNKIEYSFLFGIVLSVSVFMSWNLLVLGGFLLIYTFYCLFKSKGQQYAQIVKHSSTAFITVLIIYLVLWLVSGYNPIATFLRSLSLQKEMAVMLGRPYPSTVLFDLLDFALGAGWIGVLLVLMFMGRKVYEKKRDHEFLVSCLCMLQLFIVAAGAFLPAETARVWIFMLPLLLVPAGLELTTCNFSSRIGVFLSVWVMMVVIYQNMLFINA